MAIPKKGSRKIVVDGECYRWLIRRKATYMQSVYGSGKINVAIEHEKCEGSTLHVATTVPHPKDWNTLSPVAITPRDIEKWIRSGIKLGWAPKKKGPTFKVEPLE